MALYLLIFSAIVATCVFFNRFSGKVGIPVLLFFLMLGLLCGSQYDEFASQRGWIVGDIRFEHLGVNGREFTVIFPGNGTFSLFGLFCSKSLVSFVYCRSYLKEHRKNDNGRVD